MWDHGTGKLIEEIAFHSAAEKQAGKNACQIYSTQFQKTGDLIIAGGAVCFEAKIFVAKELFAPCATVTDLSRAVYTTDFNQAGDMCAIGGGDGVVRCFNVIGDMD